MKWLTLVVLAACGGEEASFSELHAAPTYYQDVAPIFARHCNGCHTAGNTAPIALDDVRQAQSVATTIRRETQARTMPPFRLAAILLLRGRHHASPTGGRPLSHRVHLRHPRSRW